MADAFDAVIVGGGAKGLAAAIYLAKYGGMSVGIFERRHEMGGGLSSCEASAPGFTGDPHATEMYMYNWLPVQEDFPDFVEKGGKVVQFDATQGVITREDQNGCVIYNETIDPKQERTAADIARYAGERDAETYKKMWDYARRSGYAEAWNQTFFNLSPLPGEPTAVDRWIAEYLKQPDCPFDMEWLLQPPMYGAYQLFDSPGLALMFLRKAMSAATMPADPLGGTALLTKGVLGAPGNCFVVGGTHSIAHAYIRIFLENGGKFFTHCHADKVIIDNGVAKGIRLEDGTEIEARKLVLSTLNPRQLCFELVGPERFSRRILKKVADIFDDTSITWYTWAMHDLPEYIAAQFNPDINHVQSLEVGSKDKDIWLRETALRWLGKNPPIENTLSIRSYSPVDGTRAPEGKHTILTEQFVAQANKLSEREWLEFKKVHAEDVIREWQQFAPNMTWDNIIDYDPITPYDTAGRLTNMAPYGGWCAGMKVEGWRPLSMKPITEFARHRVPGIKGLYVTGGAWMAGASCNAGYKAYKAMAEDFGLRKPWEEKGRTW